MAFRIFRQVKKKSLKLCERQFEQNFLRRSYLQRSCKSTVAINDIADSSDIDSKTNGHPNIDLTFSNCAEAYRSKSNAQLFRAWFVLKLCSWSFLVDNNKKVYKYIWAGW